MSVTFSCPGEPRRLVPCRLCDIARQDGWADENELGGRCHPTCDGTDSASAAPEVNMANANAADIIHMLGLPVEDLTGEVAVGELPALRRRIVRALNSDRSQLLRDPVELEPGHAGVVVVVGDDGVGRIEQRGCRAYIGGVADEQVVRRLTALLELAIWAQERGFRVAWG